MLIAFWQVQRLTREIHELEKQAMDVRIRLSNHQKYASILGGSSVLTLGNIAGLSSELLPRASIFAQFSDQAFGKQAISLETLIEYIDENSKAIDKELDKDKDEI